MPSYGEGFGIVLLEAMACGIPVVASKIDGSREAVRGGMLGVLVNPYDPEEIKEGILEALKKPKGIIPRGLIYFSSHNFERRCHKIIDCLRTSYIKAKEIT
jgi:glycosyltransferase involved in cell wall biosynthesis